jgi:hypothetical protein
MKLLRGVEEKEIRSGKGYGRGEHKEGDISREQIKRMIKRLKDGKAPSIDEISSEVWKYGGEGLEERAWRYCNKVWRGERWPEKWKEGVLVLILKKGTKEYRRVTLMATLYEICTMVLAKRLREEVDRRGIVPANQIGFRKEMGTMDKKGGKIVALFVDLRAAFDSVDRGILVGVMRGEGRGIREELTRKMEELMKETKSRVRAGEELGERFWMAKGG